MALTHLQGLTHSEAPKRLEISEKAVEKQVRRGRDHLRKSLVREDDGVSLGCRGASGRGGERALAALYKRRGSRGGKLDMHSRKRWLWNVPLGSGGWLKGKR
jgi:hypothetical protein